MIDLEIAAIFTTDSLNGVASMTQMNSSHLKCVVLVVDLLVTESLEVERINALILQAVSTNNVCLITLVMIVQRTLSVRVTTCFALIQSVQDLVKLVTHA